MTTTSAETFVDFLGNVLIVPGGESVAAWRFAEPPRGRRKAVPDANVEDWRALETDLRVSLWRRKSFVAWGTVEKVMPDGSALWLFIPKEFRRTLIHVSDGLTISLTGQCHP